MGKIKTMGLTGDNTSISDFSYKGGNKCQVVNSGTTDSSEITVITHPLIVTSSSAQNGGKYLFLTQIKKSIQVQLHFSIETD